MSWVDDIERYRALAVSQDPAARLTTKDGWFWRALAWVLLLLSFGTFSRRRFLTEFATTIGPIQAYPREWGSIRESTVVHEGRHVRQARWFGLGIHPWVGLPVMALVYLLLPLPVLLAYGRYRLELDASVAEWRYALSHGKASPTAVMLDASDFAETVSSSAYLWAWPESWTRRGFRRAAEAVLRERTGG